MSKILLTAIAFICMLGITVFIHEFGHFVLAKKFGVYVHEFSMGMGPKLFSKQRKETKYSLRLLPIGGFVSMAGEDVNSQPENDKVIAENRKYYNKKYYQKVLILISGVTMNFILAFSIYTGLLLHQGSYFEPIPATITEVRENSPAEKAGLLPNDKIIKVITNDGIEHNIGDFYDIQLATYDVTNEPLTYIIERNNEELTFNIVQEYHKKDDAWLIGITGTSEVEIPVKWYNAPYYGLKYTKDNFIQMIKGFKLLFQPKGLDMVSGPVGIVSVTSDVVEHGFRPYLMLIALINLNIGLVNLLPLPILDGGQVFLETVQKIFKRELPIKLKMALMYGTWAFLMIILVLVTYKDVLNII